MPSNRFRFFVFTCRDPQSDFRLPLVDALRRDHETYYIWLRRRPVVSGPGARDPFVEMPVAGLLRFMRNSRREGAVNVYFNSTNTYFPAMSALLRMVAPPGVWCFDMHDDLRYHNTGIKRWREQQIVATLCRLSDIVVHAAPTLRELFPTSVHLGNASSILPLPASESASRRVLIVASFDQRFDFDFVSRLAIASPGTSFDLYGWTRPGDIQTAAQLTELTANHPNIDYRGPYSMADLPGILGRYLVAIAPYRTDTLLTRYIDPLRFYHCLNAGLEVISTNIPQARFMHRWVHVVSDASECAVTLAAVQQGLVAKLPDYTPITWDQRAEKLTAIIEALPRTAERMRG
jgi:hypothetical protein